MLLQVKETAVVRVLAVSGSLQARSGNRVLLECAACHAPEGVHVALSDVVRELPHFDPDLEASGAPASVIAWRTAVGGADAVLIASPEYGFSLPGALKNAIDWLIGSGELDGKPVAITAAVSIAQRGRLGLGALRDTLGAVNARIVGGDPIVRGPTFEAEVAELLASLVRTARAANVAPVDST